MKIKYRLSSSASGTCVLTATVTGENVTVSHKVSGFSTAPDRLLDLKRQATERAVASYKTLVDAKEN